VARENDTKTRIIRAAEEIFATQGINGAQLREINRAAGQSNNSALHYHFGSREGLLSAVLLDHAVDLDRDRRAVIESWGQRDPTLRDVLVALALPLANKLATSSGRLFLRVLLQVREKSGLRDLPTVGEQTSSDVQALYKTLGEHLADLPVDVRADRMSNWVDMMLGSLASRAEALEAEAPSRLSHDDYLTNLIDMGEAALAAPSRIRC